MATAAAWRLRALHKEKAPEIALRGLI